MAGERAWCAHLSPSPFDCNRRRPSYTMARARVKGGIGGRLFRQASLSWWVGSPGGFKIRRYERPDGVYGVVDFVI